MEFGARHRFALALIAVLMLAAGAGAAAAHPSAQAARRRLPTLDTGELTSVVRPHSISYTGDGSGILGRLPGWARAVGKRPGFLHWTVWRRTHAEGVGTLWIKSCIPDCAGSPFYRRPVTVTAGRVRHGHFTRLTLYYREDGQNVVDRRCTVGLIYGIVLDGRCQ